MTATIMATLPPILALPDGWGEGEKDFKAIGKLSPGVMRTIEPIGPHFLAHARRARHKRTFSEDDRIQAQETAKRVEKDEESDISEPENAMLLQRDAKDWKNQDHYAVLGLTRYRWKATEDQIKRAHRKKVLRHHPDKKAAAGVADDDNFFKCIQKATEILLDPVRRRQYDSVDEEADVDPPTKKQQLNKATYYKQWGNVFQSEARFSKITPVPSFGDETSTREEVEGFYNFWYNFDSWRSFEYLDEDVPDDNENRDQKRHAERKNANARKKKKAEYSLHLRKMLDACSATDKRIKLLRHEASAARKQKKLDLEATEKLAAEEARKKKEAEALAAKQDEESAKADQQASKKAKEAARNAVKKNKRVLKASVKDANYFSSVSGDSTQEPAQVAIDAVLADVELVQGKVDANELATLAGKLNGLSLANEIKAVWTAEVKRLEDAGKLKSGEVTTLR